MIAVADFPGIVDRLNSLRDADASRLDLEADLRGVFKSPPVALAEEIARARAVMPNDEASIAALIDGSREHYYNQRPALKEAILRELRRAAGDEGRDRDDDPPAGSAAPPRKPRPPTLPPFEAFPVDALPEPIAAAACAHAHAIGCDPAMVAAPMLAVLAAAIGNARRVRVKSGWTEPAVLWCLVVAESGAVKSPALDAALAPLRQWQAARYADYAVEQERYRADRLCYERDLAAWKHAKAGDDPPDEPTRPTARRVAVEDTTTEALAVVLRENPRGLLLARDELSGWLCSFDAYRRGRGGDVARWLEMHRAGALTIDRKTGDERTIHVPRAAVSIAGTIQPRVLAAALGAEHFANGLAARILLAMSPRQLRRWRDATADEATVREYGRTVETLLTLSPGEDGDAIDLDLDADAMQAWVTWFNRHGERHDNLTGDLAAASAKLEGAAARLALVHALVRNPAATVVTAADISAGTRLADWFQAEAERVYGVLSETPVEAEERELVEWLGRRGGQATAAELARSGPRRFRGFTDVAEVALSRLVASSQAEWIALHRSRAAKLIEIGDDGVDTVPPSTVATPLGRPGFVALDHGHEAAS